MPGLANTHGTLCKLVAYWKTCIVLSVDVNPYHCVVDAIVIVEVSLINIFKVVRLNYVCSILHWYPLKEGQ